jgi:epoxyqueuosine reductase
MSSNTHKYSRIIKEAASRHGFMGAGIARAEYMEEEAARLEQWLSEGHHGEMAYMANHFDMRVDPTKLVPGAKSVISLVYNYYPGEWEAEADPKAKEGLLLTTHTSTPLSTSNSQLTSSSSRLTPHESILTTHTSTPLSTSNSKLTIDNSQLTSSSSRLTPHESNLTTHASRLTKMKAPSAAATPADEESFKISRYAYGEDYHKVVRRKLKALVSELKKEIGDFNARVFVDSAPVLERDWAKRSGQGWIGKNTLLIHPKKGSYFFLAEIILDVDLEYDHPMRDHCGTCTKCIDACPTEAISPQGYLMDGSKCISYLTIELKSQIPASFKEQMEGWIYGCDICQEVCPWNRFSTPHAEPAFEMSDQLRDMKGEDWLEITQEVFDGLFSKSAVKRAGYEGLKRNIKFLSSDNQ